MRNQNSFSIDETSTSTTMLTEKKKFENIIPHVEYKIRYKVSGVEHDGYCSDPYEWKDIDDERILTRRFYYETQPTELSDFNKYDSACQLGSGYCGGKRLTKIALEVLSATNEKKEPVPFEHFNHPRDSE